MKLTNTAPGGIANGAMEQTTAKIKISSHAFNILASGLYTDKIAAVLREVGCNARDAHVAAGKPNLPIRVKLPSVFDRVFSIRDWGIGLDKDEVMNMYVTFFESTKASSDDFVGAFGLGSKSPFAYTDTFSVVAAKDGVSRTFTVFRDEGVPKCVFMHETRAPHDWPSGLEVSFPVRGEDVSTFSQKAAEVYEFWDVRPEFVGAEVKFPEYPGEVRYTNCVVYKNSNRRYPEVVMGGVRYPIHDNIQKSLFDFVSEDGRAAGQSHINYQRPDVRLMQLVLGMRPVFTVPIGLLEVTPSREALSMTIRTTANLAKFVLDVGKEMAQTLLKHLELQPGETVWHASKRCADEMNSMGRSNANAMLWNYEVLHPGTQVPASAKAVLDATLRVKAGFRLNICENYGRLGRVRLMDVYVEQTTGDRTVSLQGDTRFVIDDLGSPTAGSRRLLHSEAKIRKDLDYRERRARYVYFIVPGDKTLAEVKDALGNPPDDMMVMTSSLPKPERVVSQAVSGSGKVTVYPKHAVGNVQAELYRWNAQAGEYVKDDAVDRVALLDGSSWTLVDESAAGINSDTDGLLHGVFTRAIVGCLSDSDRVRCGLDVVVAVKAPIYARYITEPSFSFLGDNVVQAIETDSAIRALAPLVRLVRAKEAMYGCLRSGVASEKALLSDYDVEFVRRIAGAAAYGHWLKGLMKLTTSIDRAVNEGMRHSLLRIVSRHEGRTESYSEQTRRVLEQYAECQKARSEVPVGDTVPGQDDWSAAFELAVGDDLQAVTEALSLANMRPMGFTKTVLAWWAGALLRETEKTEAERYADVLKRLSARKRRQQRAALKRERAAKRTRRRAVKTVMRGADAVTLDMFAVSGPACGESGKVDEPQALVA